MRSTHSGYPRLTKAHKFSAAALTAAGAAAVAFGAASQAVAAPVPASVKPVAQSVESFAQTQDAERAQATDKAAAQAKAEAAKAKAEAKADKERAGKQAANRSTTRKPIEKPAAAPAPKVYADDLEGWISEALDIMKAKGIPASYEGVKRNIMRESTGNPRAINDWDVNAVNGVPSKGLLQIIDPTFKAYHVEGTSWDIWDPVANIVASCNYAADKYGSMDNVNSAY
ncbi:transglycosylase SLT domain-containing protein [Streptomyces sp. URMC 126]|uniref:transglycosylase SLT domain-containing protein n=1 Tax=Streptomyces sp. URMC 126 TaxID=3423401 RepID=UPI003F1D0EEB